MKINRKLLYEALKIVNLQFENNVNILLGKDKKNCIDLTNFKKELLKNNPQAATISNEALYRLARKLILKGIRQSVPRKPPF